MTSSTISLVLQVKHRVRDNEYLREDTTRITSTCFTTSTVFTFWRHYIFFTEFGRFFCMNYSWEGFFVYNCDRELFQPFRRVQVYKPLLVEDYMHLLHSLFDYWRNSSSFRQICTTWTTSEEPTSFPPHWRTWIRLLWQRLHVTDLGSTCRGCLLPGRYREVSTACELHDNQRWYWVHTGPFVMVQWLRLGLLVCAQDQGWVAYSPTVLGYTPWGSSSWTWRLHVLPELDGLHWGTCHYCVWSYYKPEHAETDRLHGHEAPASSQNNGLFEGIYSTGYFLHLRHADWPGRAA